MALADEVMAVDYQLLRIVVEVVVLVLHIVVVVAEELRIAFVAELVDARVN